MTQNVLNVYYMTHSEPISSYIKFIGYFISFLFYGIFLLYNWCYVKKTKIERDRIQVWLDKSNELRISGISTAGDVENQVTLLNPSTINAPQQEERKEEEEKHNDNEYIKFEFEIKNALLRSSFAVARIVGDLINSTVIIIYFNYFTGLQLMSIFGIIQLVIYGISMIFDLIDIIIHLIPKTKQKILENYVLTDSFNAKYYFIQFIHAYFNFFSLFFTIYLCQKTLSKFDTYWIITLSFTNKIKSILEIHWKSFEKLVFNYSLTHKKTKCDKIISWLIKKLIYVLSELLLYIPLFLISSSIITCFVSTDNNNVYFNGLLPIWFIICTFYSARKLLLYYKCFACINSNICTKCNICFGFILVSTLLACIHLGFLLYCFNGETYYYSYTSLFIFVFISLVCIILLIQIPGACTFIMNHLCLMLAVFCVMCSSAFGANQQIEYNYDPNADQRPAIVIIFEFILLFMTYFVLMPFIVIIGIWTKDIQIIFIPLVVMFVGAGCCGVVQFLRSFCSQSHGISFLLQGIILIVFCVWFVWELQIVDYTN